MWQQKFEFANQQVANLFENLCGVFTSARKNKSNNMQLLQGNLVTL